MVACVLTYVHKYGTYTHTNLNTNPLLTIHVQGDVHFYGKQGVQFYTQIKTISSNWDTKVGCMLLVCDVYEMCVLQL
ncbi:hypothetical protein EON63_00475 [archaeon]|nr:MAG: hypothetical protein EON63_00475 [archaeon]